MNWNRFFIAATFLGVIGTSTVKAQQTIRLQFEISKDGSTVGTPQVSVSSGSTGSMDINDVGTVSFTPIDTGRSVRIRFDITSGGREFHPSVEIAEDSTGSLSWTSTGGSELFRLTVARVR